MCQLPLSRGGVALGSGFPLLPTRNQTLTADSGRFGLHNQKQEENPTVGAHGGLGTGNTRAPV